MPILTEKDRAALKEMFDESLVGPVKLLFFKSVVCQLCDDEETLLREVADLSDKIELEVKDLVEDKELAQRFGIEYAPGLAVTPPDRVVKAIYTGAPFGYEFSALIDDIRSVSRGQTGLQPDTIEKIKSITKPVHIKVFVTPSCPYCPKAVSTAHKFAMENELITGEMIEAQEFPDIASLYNVYAVPKVVINDRVEFEGAYPEKQFLEFVLEAVEE